MMKLCSSSTPSNAVVEDEVTVINTKLTMTSEAPRARFQFDMKLICNNGERS